MNDSTSETTINTVKLVYILYIVGLMTGGITTLIGVVIAYVNRDSAPEWIQTHYRFLIRGFWIGIVYGFMAMIFAITIILLPLAWLLGMFMLVWVVVRAIKGIQVLGNNEPHPKPTSWMFG